MPLPTARSPPPDSADVGTDVVCRCVVHLAADDGASLHLERVFADDGADGAWNAGEDVSDDDEACSREQHLALNIRSGFGTTSSCPELDCKCIEGRARRLHVRRGDGRPDVQTISQRLESNARYRCVVRAGRYDYITSIAGDWCFVTGEGLQRG